MAIFREGLVLLLFTAICLSTTWTLAAAQVKHPLFVLDNGTKDANHVTPKAQAELLKELGYAGIGHSTFQGIPEMLKELDANGLKMSTVYISSSVEADRFTVEPGFKEAALALKGRDTIIWVPITSKTFPASSEDGDAQAVAMMREMADQAPELRFALYPHTGFWLEKIEDAVRVAKKVDRKNVGATFNLCHWLNAGRGKNLRPLLEQAMPNLFVVTLNGADHEGGWDRLIQPLDKGTFDVAAFLGILKELGYTGPIGLQCYGIKGDVHDNLARSMAAWRKLTGDK